jgi:hypothetical protein
MRGQERTGEDRKGHVRICEGRRGLARIGKDTLGYARTDEDRKGHVRICEDRRG